MKKFAVRFGIFVLLFACLAGTAFAVKTEDIRSVADVTAAHVYAVTPHPTVSATGGEWAVIGLAKSGAAVPDAYFDGYYTAVCERVRTEKGVLSARKNTEYARVCLALTVLGKDAADVAGYNLYAPLYDFDATMRQGINGAAWALIALTKRAADGDKDAAAACERYLETLLAAQYEGGFAVVSGEEPDADVTAMALIALAPYAEREEVRKAADAAFAYLSGAQTAEGGFASRGNVNAESDAQVILALCAWKIPLDDARFVKNGASVLDNLLTFHDAGGGFRHLLTDEQSDSMATEQALLALAALVRSEADGEGLFTPREKENNAQTSPEHADFGLPGKHADVKKLTVSAPKSFRDMAEHPAKDAVETLAARGVINGKAEGVFDPDGLVTRAEFAAIVTKSLGLTDENAAPLPFEDVQTDAWFYGAVAAAYHYEITAGVSDTAFAPHGSITREEAAVMISRAAKLCGLNTERTNPRDVLAVFTDYRTASDWARSALAFCYDTGILSDEDSAILPKKCATRAEIAEMTANMLSPAELL